MKKYLLLLHEKLSEMEKLSEAEIGELVNAYIKWTTVLVEQGHLLAGDGIEETGVQIVGKEATIIDEPNIKLNEWRILFVTSERS